MSKVIDDLQYKTTNIKLSDLEDKDGKCGWIKVCDKKCAEKTKDDCPEVIRINSALQKISDNIKDEIIRRKFTSLRLNKREGCCTADNYKRYWWCRWLFLKNDDSDTEYTMTFRCDNYEDLRQNPPSDNDFLMDCNDKVYHDFENVGKIQFVQDKANGKRYNLFSMVHIWPLAPGASKISMIRGEEAEDLAKLPSRLLLQVLNDNYSNCYFHVEDVVDENGDYIKGGEKLAESIARIFVKWVIALEA